MNSREEEPATRLKEAIFIFSTPLAIFLFDSDLKLLQKVKTANPDEAIALIVRNEWQAEELALIKSAIADDKAVIVLGLRKEKIEGVAFSQDVKKLQFATIAAAEDLSKLREVVLSLAKKSIAESVSDDNLIIQASCAIGELNKTASLLVKRVREWYELYCPEASKQIANHEEFINTIAAVPKDELLKRFKVREPMGADIEKADIRMIFSFVEEVRSIYDMRKRLAEYVESLMKRHAPNVAAVAGPSTGAELISEAGSLQRLAMLPSSTIQLLGAEQELFLHLKDKKQRPPKVGVLHSHPLVTSAPRKEQGRAAKIIADKISIASRVDFFRGSFVGDRLLSEVRARLAK